MAYINTPPVVTNGLILHLDAGNRLSYTSGSTVWNDLSGNNNSGSLTNGPTFNSANQGSIVFDGSNDYVVMNKTITPTSNITYIVFLWKNGTPQSAYAGILVGREGTLSALGICMDSSGINTWVFWNSSVVNGIPIPDQSWCMLAMTNTTGGNNIMYSYSSTSKSIVTTNAAVNSVNNATLYVGSDALNAGRYFNGRIGYSMIYNRALSTQEINQNYNALKNRYGLT